MQFYFNTRNYKLGLNLPKQRENSIKDSNRFKGNCDFNTKHSVDELRNYFSNAGFLLNFDNMPSADHILQIGLVNFPLPSEERNKFDSILVEMNEVWIERTNLIEVYKSLTITNMEMSCKSNVAWPEVKLNWIQLKRKGLDHQIKPERQSTRTTIIYFFYRHVVMIYELIMVTCCRLLFSLSSWCSVFDLLYKAYSTMVL